MNQRQESSPSDPLGLRGLPQRHAPEALWSSLEQRLDHLQAPAGRRMRWALPGAIAAALMTALVLPQFWWNHTPEDASLATTAVLTTTSDAPTTAPSREPHDQLRSARALSGLLEAELQRTRGEILRVGDMDDLVWAETELRLTDDLLSDDPDNLNLWSQRIALLGRMNARYQQNDWREDLQLTRL